MNTLTSRKTARALSLLLLCSGLCVQGKQPNILIILVDDMGYGDVGFTGSTQIKTPNLDKLAGSGIVFNQAYVTAPFCGPSRAALLTGRYQGRFGFDSNPVPDPFMNNDWLGLPLEEKTVGDRMRAVGYDTAAIGKWHLGAADHFYPTERGFDYFFGMRHGGHSYFPTLERKDKPGYWYPHFALERMGEPLKEIEVPYLTDWFTEDAMNYMDRKGKGEKPWFLYLAYNAPHGPLEAKPEDMAKYSHVKHKGRRTYCAMVDNLDQNIGHLVEKLKATGQYENTVIFFLNDNGGSVETVYALNAPFWGTKGTFYEGGLRVPMFIHAPGRFKAAEYNKPVTAMDLVPTCIALAGGEQPERTVKQGRREKVILDGVNLLPFLKGELADARPYDKIYWRVNPRGSAMLDGDWKYIQTPHSVPLLFNISEDPAERNNLAGEHPEILARLMDQHYNWTLTHDREPMWMDSPGWGASVRNIHRKQFQLTQPTE